MDPAWQRELAEFLRIPSVSADPIFRERVIEAGEWVCDFIRRSGGSAELTPLGERELALGEFRASHGADEAPTVLCYGHFDVQPPAPMDLWESDPFELTIRDGWAYARGVTDDKGQLWMLLKAAQELVAESALPVNLRFACDGEEETGGTTIVDYLTGVDGPAADAAVIFDGGMLREDLPVFDLATRGLIAFDVVARTGVRDLHSGLFGGVALNAIHALMQAMLALLARDGRLPEPLRQGIAPPTEEELAQWAALPAGAEQLDGQGARPLDVSAAEDFYVRTWAEPSLDVNGILGGKPGLRNTTLSVAASAEFTIRLAPGQDAQTIGATAERMLREAAPEGTDLDIRWAGVQPGLVQPDARAVQLGLDSFERALGVRPRLVRSGGTLPIVPALADRGIPTILTGFGVPESNVHSPNEKMLVRYFEQGVATARELYLGFAALRSW